jgi:hypothetical protein
MRRTLLRFLAPTALPICRDLPLPGFAILGHVASSHLPCASTPYSLSRLPGVLSTRCAHGTPPFRALPNRDRRSLSTRLPLLRLAMQSRVRQAVKPTFAKAPPRKLAIREDWLIGRATSRPSLSGSSAPTRCQRKRHRCLQRPRFRGLIPLQIRITAARFLRLGGTLALLGFILPRAFPFPCLGPPGGRRLLASHFANPAASPLAFTTPDVSTAFGLLSALQKRPRSGSFSLCFKVSKSWEVGLPLPRLPAP